MRPAASPTKGGSAVGSAVGDPVKVQVITPVPFRSSGDGNQVEIPVRFHEDVVLLPANGRVATLVVLGMEVPVAASAVLVSVEVEKGQWKGMEEEEVSAPDEVGPGPW